MARTPKTRTLPKLPKYLEWWKNGTIIRARVQVPAPLVKTLGCVNYYRSTGTACVSKAEDIARSFIEDCLVKIDQARPEPTGRRVWTHRYSYRLSGMSITDAASIADAMHSLDDDDKMALLRQIASEHPQLRIAERVGIAGRFEDVSNQPPTDTTGNAPIKLAPITFGAAVELWGNENTIPPKTRRDYAAKMRVLADYLSHDIMGDVTRANMIAFKESMIQDGELSAKTIKNYLANIRTIFKHASDNDKITADPFKKPVTYRVKSNKRNTRLDFEPEDRLAIYSTALRETDPLYKFGNLLPLFSGMRVEEFAESDTRHVKVIDGIVCLLINYDHRTENQNIKTDESIRKIPLHRAGILDHGFMDYVNSLPDGPLFPMLRKNQDGRLSDDASRKLGVWLRKVAKITDPRKVNHSHRHSAETLMLGKVDKRIAYRITGHSAADVGETYLHPPIPELLEAIETIPVPH